MTAPRPTTGPRVNLRMRVLRIERRRCALVWRVVLSVDGGAWERHRLVRRAAWPSPFRRRAAMWRLL